MRSVYLDNNSTTPVLPGVFKAMEPYLVERFGNPSAIYERGRSALAAVKTARASVARLLDCQPAEVIFTSGGTEGDNLAIRGLAAAGDHLITSVIEHSAVTQSFRALQRAGCDVTLLPVNSKGQVDPADVRRALRPSTKLISIMLANNETGVLQPVEEIGKIAIDAGVHFHIDAVQGAGKVPISVQRFGCDLLTISGHKMHAPQGIGALFVRRGVPLKSLLLGGRQENGHRAGTENVPGIVALGAAAEIAMTGLLDGSIDKVRRLRDQLEQGITTAIPETGVNGRGAPRVANTANIYFDHIGGDSLVLALDAEGVEASRGAACHSAEQEPSSVLMAMGIGGERSRSSLRFSLGKQNSESDIDAALSVLPQAVAALRERAPFYRKNLRPA